MKKALIVGGILVLAVLGIGVYFFVSTRTAAPVKPSTTVSPFGFSGGTVSAQKTLPLTLSDNSVVPVRDFTKDGQPDWAGDSSGFLVAGSETDPFIILYFKPDHEGGQGEFLMSLNTEPLGDTRRRAEAALKARLEMNETELCKLTVTVAVSPGVSDTYRGQNLKMSFCQGAVALP